MNSKFIRFFVLVLFVTTAVSVAIIRPWRYFSLISPQAALTVSATSGKLAVKLNGKKIGETPYSTDNLKPGDHDLELTRVGENAELYYTLRKRIHLEPDTRTVIKAELGPESQFSSWSIVYFQKNNLDQAQVYVRTYPDGARVSLDDVRYGDSPVSATITRPASYNLKAELDGHETLEVKIQPLAGYILIADIELMANPFEIKEANIAEE